MIKKLLLFVTVLTIGVAFISCTPKDPTVEEANPKNDTYYEVFVRSFADSDGDGIGDFNGITDKLSYFQTIGITGLWLMPINPSPSYHGYDVTDYYDVNSDYGTMEDFDNLISTASSMGIKIMMDMVFNHTSNQHPWFLAALDGDEKYQDYYVFIDKSSNTSSVLGSWGQNIWHTIDDMKYCGYFSNTMPDLNMYSDAVKEEILNISKFWIDKGVSGFRLDAAHHYFGDNEYLLMDNNYLDNVVYLKHYKQDIDEYTDNFYLIGEIYIEDLYQIVGDYFAGLDSPLDFPVAAKIRSSVQSTINRTYVSNLVSYYNYYRSINEDFISTPFIVNHDMNRLASTVLGNQDTLKLSAEMLLTLPGNPIIYYGEEIGMYGYKASGPDIWDETRRLPLLWGDDYTTDWVESANIALSNLNDMNLNVYTITEQLNDSNSLLTVYEDMSILRNNNIALKYGNSFEAYENNTPSLQGYYREYQYLENYQKVLVLHNFSNSDIAMVEYTGTVLYASGLTDLTDVQLIPARGTVVIDISGEDADA
ncbi:MAG: alpha-amylase [Firmicutes bacterium]|nr:alpha-amylase [Bacillota bacterium]